MIKIDKTNERINPKIITKNSSIATTAINNANKITNIPASSNKVAINLVKYQHAYNLASQMVQVLTEVYDRLILQTGV